VALVMVLVKNNPKSETVITNHQPIYEHSVSLPLPSHRYDDTVQAPFSYRFYQELKKEASISLSRPQGEKGEF
jgi:hypothetical protein